jgi:hypothetical protein
VATILRRIAQACVVVTLAALTGAGLSGAPPMVIPAAVLGALAGIVSYVVAVSPTTSPRTEPRPVARGRAWCAGAFVALLAVAINGMAVLLGDTTGPLLLFVVLAVTARLWPRDRPALAWIRAGRRVAPPAPAPDRSPAGPASPLRGATSPLRGATSSLRGATSLLRGATSPLRGATSPLRGATLSTCGTAALCATWQRSYHHLGEVADEAALDALLDLRRRCLDEFERRDPAGTARWLASEPRPAGTGPHRHVHPGRLRPAASSPRPPDGLSGGDPTTPQAPPVPPA